MTKLEATFMCAGRASRNISTLHKADDHSAVFTSAKPIAVWVGAAWALTDEKFCG